MTFFSVFCAGQEEGGLQQLLQSPGFLQVARQYYLLCVLGDPGADVDPAGMHFTLGELAFIAAQVGSGRREGVPSLQLSSWRCVFVWLPRGSQ